MKNPLQGLLFTCGALLFAAANSIACPIDYSSGDLQYGAGSRGAGILGNPIGLPQTCGTAPVSQWGNAGPLGGSYWEGTGYADPGVLSTDYVFTLGSGWWGYSVAAMGLLYIPDLVVTGGAASTVTASVNVQYGGTASGYVPASQDINWAVDVLDLAGNLLTPSYVSTLSYAPNGPTQTGTSGMLGNIPVGTPFALQLRAQWYHEGPPFGSYLTTTGDSFLQFLASEVLNLPAGYTVNSASAGIVDNVFTANVVPLPAAAWLFASALGLLGWLKRHSRAPGPDSRSTH